MQKNLVIGYSIYILKKNNNIEGCKTQDKVADPEVWESWVSKKHPKQTISRGL